MKNNYKPSIMQTKCECYLCHKGPESGLEVHHAIPGRGNRKICTELGLTVWLCSKCHDNLHNHNIGYKEVQAAAQEAFIKDMKHQGYPVDIAREEWYRRFLKYYD